MPPKRKRTAKKDSPLTVDMVKNFTVAQLKKELKKFGLDTTGLKKKLFKRLSAALLSASASSSVIEEPAQTDAASKLDAPAAVHQEQEQEQEQQQQEEEEEEQQQDEEPSRKRRRPDQTKSPSKKAAAKQSSSGQKLIAKEPEKLSATSSSSSSSASSSSSTTTVFEFEGHHIEADRPLTVRELAADRIYTCAQQHWSEAPVKTPNQQLIKHLHDVELEGGAGWYSRTMALDATSYLENYLWSSYPCNKKTITTTTTTKKKEKKGTAVSLETSMMGASFEHTASLILLINFRIGSGAPIFSTLLSSENGVARFKLFFQNVLDLFHDDTHDDDTSDETMYQLHLERLEFLVNVVEMSDAHPQVSECVRGYLCSIGCWSALSDFGLEEQFVRFPSLRAAFKERDSTTTSKFLPKLCSDVCDSLEILSLQEVDGVEVGGENTEEGAAATAATATATSNEISSLSSAVAVKSLLLIVSLLRRRETRPYLLPILSDLAFVARSLRSLSQHMDSSVHRMVHRVAECVELSISNERWLDLPPMREREIRVGRFEKLQSYAFEKRFEYPTLRSLALATYRTIINDSNFLRRSLELCSPDPTKPETSTALLCEFLSRLKILDIQTSSNILSLENELVSVLINLLWRLWAIISYLPILHLFIISWSFIFSFFFFFFLSLSFTIFDNTTHR